MADSSSGGNTRKTPLPDLTGTVLGNVTLLQRVGEGSMGVVYRGYQSGLSRTVAVKVVFRGRFNKLFTPERFRHEAELVANLFHPQIVPIFEYGERPDYLYFVMQFVEGYGLHKWLTIKKEHPLPRKRLPTLGEIIPVAEQVLEVLDFAHREGVVHRDIKPENILFLERQNKIMVADFGLATVNASFAEEEKAFILGSPLYVSPEQARGEIVDGRADMFSLGCVLLESTLGFLPAKVERPEKIFRSRAQESPEMFSGMAKDLSPTVPAIWSDFIAKALEPKRDKRYQDVGQMLESLRNLKSELLRPGSGA